MIVLLAMKRPADAKKTALQLSLFAIATVFAFEFIAGAATNSLALFTDGTHALLDAVVTAVLIIAVRLASKPRDKDHTYGHGRIETIGGFVGGIALFVVSILFIFEAVTRIAGYYSGAAMSQVTQPGLVAYAAIAYTLSVDGFRVTVLRRALVREQAADSGSSVALSSTTLKTDMYHALTDMVSTGVALVGLLLVARGFAAGDSLAAIVLGGFLAFLSSKFAYQNVLELSDSIPPSLVAKATEAAQQTPGVLDCKDVKMRRVGRDVYVELTLGMRSDLSFEVAHETSVLVENNVTRILADVLGSRPITVTVHFEPEGAATRPSIEDLVERAARLVDGVRGVHNIIVSAVKDSNRKEASLHIQVNRSATLAQAHAISNSVEDSIRNQVPEIQSTTVHVEPFMPELLGIEPISDKAMQDSIREIVVSSRGVRRAGRINTYRTVQGSMKIDVDCVFQSTSDGAPIDTIEQVHQYVSDIEERILQRFPGSIVTIHAEPE